MKKKEANGILKRIEKGIRLKTYNSFALNPKFEIWCEKNNVDFQYLLRCCADSVHDFPCQLPPP